MHTATPTYQDVNIEYPSSAKAIVDVTKPPYNADNSGREDCTEALRQAYNDAIRPVLENFQETRRQLRENPEGDFGFESGKNHGVLFANKTPQSKILYFPNGTYKVSNTIVYSFKNLQNTSGSELNRQIHFKGQSRNGVVIKLQDHAKGFGMEGFKPVVSFMRAEGFEDKIADFTPGQNGNLHQTPGMHSNVAMSNTFENFTINTGAGNPGAIGLLFHCSNSGSIRNVRIVSGDPQKAGKIGLAIIMGKPMGPYVKNLSVDGFDYGIKVNDFMLYTVFEHITLAHQQVAGFNIVDNPVSVRDLNSNNQVPAFQLTGPSGHLVAVDCKLTGGDAGQNAIDYQHGFLNVRNISTIGYGAAIGNRDSTILTGGRVALYSSHGIQRLGNDTNDKTFPLEVKETPEIPWEYDFTQWADVGQYGARGDAQHDDTHAIQDALDSGKPVVFFQPGQYLIDSTIVVPPSVQRIDFMFADLKAGEHLKEMKATFKITGNSEKPLLMENLFAWEQYYGNQYLVDHASKRTLVLKDLHTQVGAVYINSVEGGQVFIEDVACTEGQYKQNCYSFTGQKVWARQLNPERANPEVIVDHSEVWVLGFKTEMSGTSFDVLNHSSLEVLGGVVNNFGDQVPPDRPIILNRNSSVLFTAVTNGSSREGHYFNTIVEQKQPGAPPRTLMWKDVPRRYGVQSVVPWYVGGE